jgi:hypothetical protein
MFKNKNKIKIITPNPQHVPTFIAMMWPSNLMQLARNIICCLEQGQCRSKTGIPNISNWIDTCLQKNKKQKKHMR